VFGRVGVRLASAAAAMARGVKAMSPRPLVQHVEQARVYFSGMRHGVKGMYRGFGYSTALQMPSNMIYLSSYLVITEALQAQLERCCTNSAAARCRLEGLAALIPVTAAMCSETLVSLIEVPHDVITQKLQVQHAARSQGFQRSWRTPSRGVDAVRKVVAVHGWKSLYVGTRAHLLTSVPWSATWWGTYEGGKFALHGLCSLMNAHASDGTRAAICCRELSAHIATMTPVLAGMTAGLLAAVMANPIDVVKTRIQCQAHLKGQGIITVARNLVAREGPQALFKGLALAIMFDVLVSSTAGLRYELVTHWAAKTPLEKTPLATC